MKKIMFSLAIICTISSSLFCMPANKVLKGAIYSLELESLPSFKVYFQGAKTTSNDDGFFSIPLETAPAEKYSLLICRNLVPKFESINTIGNIEINPQKKYRYFTFKRHPKKIGQWIIKEKKLTSKNFIIPKNCIVVDMKPTLVKRIENWNFTLDNNFVAIPKIVLKKGLETKNLKHTKSVTRSSLKSELNSLDIKTFHEQIDEENKVFPNKPEVKSSLVQPK